MEKHKPYRRTFTQAEAQMLLFCVSEIQRVFPTAYRINPPFDQEALENLMQKLEGRKRGEKVNKEQAK